MSATEVLAEGSKCSDNSYSLVQKGLEVTMESAPRVEALVAKSKELETAGQKSVHDEASIWDELGRPGEAGASTRNLLVGYFQDAENLLSEMWQNATANGSVEEQYRVINAREHAYNEANWLTRVYLHTLSKYTGLALAAKTAEEFDSAYSEMYERLFGASLSILNGAKTLQHKIKQAYDGDPIVEFPIEERIVLKGEFRILDLSQYDAAISINVRADKNPLETVLADAKEGAKAIDETNEASANAFINTSRYGEKFITLSILYRRGNRKEVVYLALRALRTLRSRHESPDKDVHYITGEPLHPRLPSHRE